MTKTIEIPDDLFQRLQSLAIPLVDTPSSVIERLLEHYEKGTRLTTAPAETISTVSYNNINKSLGRVPRERGVRVKFNGETIDAISVADLYLKTMEFLSNNDFIEQIKPHLPILTSNKRYLIATTPIHPTGKPFRTPVEHNGYYMEAHKSYKTAIDHLEKVLKYCGLSLTYLG